MHRTVPRRCDCRAWHHGPVTDTAAPALDLSFVDPQTRIQDDLFGHVNGRWLAEHTIPDDRSTDGAFYALRDAAELHVKQIIEECAAEDAAADGGSETGDGARIGRLYRSFMDTAAIEVAGLEPIRADLDLLRGADTPASLAAALGALQRTGIGGLIGYFVDTDAKNPDRYLVQLGQSGISLPDEAYYREEQYAPIREQFVAHVARTFALAEATAPGLLAGLVDLSDSADSGDFTAAAAGVLELETAIAAGHWSVVERRDADKTYNLRTFAEFEELASGLAPSDWARAVAGEVAPLAEINLREPSFFSHVARLLTERPAAQWRTWAAWKVLGGRSAYLPEAFVDERFGFYGTVLSGTPENRERWKRGVSLVEEHLGFAVGELYTARHFPADSKAQMRALVDNLVAAYRERITELEWMTPATREKALVKLAAFTPKIGYPDSARDYSALIIDADLIGNVRRGNAFEHDREFGKIGGPVDRDEWFMTPQTVNAYYNPGMNEIVFPAAILQPPFFSPTADDAVNYGAIGAVIGHEIGHGFDDQGSKYDGAGALDNWWTDADRAEFSARTHSLIEQYDGFSPRDLSDVHHVNGAFTIGENIGDLGGLGIALVAYRMATAGASADSPVEIDGLSGVQRVFFSWAQVWRGKSRDEEAIRRLATDPHSPAEFRCNGIASNLREFYEAFEVRPGDGMFLDPERRVTIW
jgi:putative endopeptidase